METWEWLYSTSENQWNRVSYEELMRLFESGELRKDTRIGWVGMEAPGFTIDQIDADFFYPCNNQICSAYSESELHAAFSENKIGQSTKIWGKTLPPSGVLYEQLFFHSVEFLPTVQEFVRDRSQSQTTVLSGPNNSGKSLMLKLLRKELGHKCALLASNRFYHFDRLGTTTAPKDQPLTQRHYNFVTQLIQSRQNTEASDYPLMEIIAQMSDVQRQQLFELSSKLLEEPVQILKADPENELSYRYVQIGSDNLTLASTGTRLLIAILAACLDTSCSYLVIDEPEIGLSPKLQLALARLLYDPTYRNRHFPHIDHLYVATHSHLFLDRWDLNNNFVVTKNGRNVSIQQVDKIADFHELQFRMLGNDLSSLFLPSAIILVEGPTDQKYIKKLCSSRFPHQAISVVATQGDGRTKEHLHTIRESLGDLEVSPYRDRLLVLLDQQNSVKLSQLENLGVRANLIVTLNKNGIEHYYPSAILCRIFHCDQERLQTIQIEGNHVSLNGVRKPKTALCDEVVSLMTDTTEIPEELQYKLLDPLERIIT